MKAGNYTQRVDIFRNIFKGPGSNDESDIYKIFVSKKNQERSLIKRLYNQKYNKDLVNRL